MQQFDKNIGSKAEALIKARGDDGNIQNCIENSISTKLFLYFVVISTLIGVSKYVGGNIECRIPVEQRIYSKYSKMLCLLSNTYYWSQDEPFLKFEPHKREYIRYYPILGLFLIASAFLTAFPLNFWNRMADRSAFGVKLTVKLILFWERSILTSRVSEIYVRIANSFLNWSHINNRCRKYCHGHSTFFLYTDLARDFLVKSYFVFKALQVIAVLACIMIWHHILNRQFLTLGFSFIKRASLALARKVTYKQSKLFPLVPVCDVLISASSHYTYECMFTRNIFHDFALTATWFVLMIALIATIYNFVASCIRLNIYRMRRTRLELYLKYFLIQVQEGTVRRDGCTGCKDKPDPCKECFEYFNTKTYTQSQIDAFLEQCLSPDMQLVLYFIEDKTEKHFEHIVSIIKLMWIKKHLIVADEEDLKSNNLEHNDFFDAQKPSSDSEENTDDVREYVDSH